MTTFGLAIAALLINYIISEYSGVAFGILCVYLFGSCCFDYLRKRSYNRILKQIADGNMDCECYHLIQLSLGA